MSSSQSCAATRRLGTLSLSSAILSLSFVRYRFSTMLWVVFFSDGLRLLDARAGLLGDVLLVEDLGFRRLLRAPL